MKKTFWMIAVAGLLLVSCREKYLPPALPGTSNNLVVEGVINSAGPTNIELSRTVKLDTFTVVHETGAHLSVEGEDNSQFLLNELGNGNYGIDTLPLQPGVKYRLRIQTTDGHQYLSDYTPVLITPPIDSLSWRVENDGVQIYIHTHDSQNNTWYYHWEFAETWEFHSKYYTNLKYRTDAFGNPVQVIYRDPVTTAPDLSLFTCWQTVPSSQVLIGSSIKLGEDLINLPLAYIPPASEKLSVLYSIYVKQYALTPDAYEFFRRLKKNTESVGSILDPQPSELAGNIHCISNPEEQVVGYMTVSNMSDLRIFISNRDVPDWGYAPSCYQEDIPNIKDSVMAYDYLMPTYPSETGPFNSIVRYYASLPYCVDCTLRGTNVKPDFWP